MRTYEYNELPEDEQLIEFEHQLEIHLGLLPIEYEYEKRPLAEKIARASCECGIYMEAGGSYFRCELTEIK